MKLPCSIPAPLVSVILTTVNRPERLEESVSSVLAQTFMDFELIVVNDAGESVEDLLLGFDDDRISYIRLGKNRKLASARNAGVALSRGKYLCYLDDDDVYYPDHLETLVNFLEGQSKFKVAYTDSYCAHQELQGDRWVTVKKELVYSNDFDRRLYLTFNPIPVLCIMHHRKCIEDVGGYDYRFEYNEDYELWVRMSKKYPFHHIKKVTSEYRHWNREDQITFTLRDKMIEARDRVQREHLSSFRKWEDFKSKNNMRIKNLLGIKSWRGLFRKD